MGLLRSLLVATFAILSGPSWAAGTLPIVLQQQFAFTGCATTPTTSACGQPLAGGLLYFYQVGTVATRQDSFQDTGLTIPNSWPIVLDQNGRVPPFYLADGSIHIRLTDSAGVVQFDYPSMLVIGPSSGGGGGGSVDPTTVASTGDIKFRPTNDALTGWVKMNGQTIGSATSGATGRANADTQALYVYLWTTFSQPSGNVYCAVSGGLGASALADFNANKALIVLDLRGRSFAGFDGMGNSRANRIPDSIIIATVSGGTSDSLGALGGAATQTVAQNQLPNVAPTWTASNTYTPTGTNSAPTFTASNSIPNHIPQATSAWASAQAGGGTVGVPQTAGTLSDLTSYAPAGTVSAPTWTASNTYTPTGNVGSINGNVAQQALPTLNAVFLGTWYIKL